MESWFTLKNPPFCESQLYSFEYTNFISAFFIQGVSLWALFSNPITNVNIFYILVSLFLNGVASAGFHATLENGWGILDTVSMILPTYFGLVEIIHILLLFRVAKQRGDGVRRDDGVRRGGYTYTRQCLDVLCITILLTLMYLTIAFMQVQTSFSFTLLFALPQLALALLLVLESILVLRSMRDCKSLLLHLWTGVGVILFGAIFWLSTEPYCYNGGHWWLPYLFSHAVWHVTSSYGYYKIVVTQIYLRAYLLNHGVTLSSVSDPHWYTFLFPRIILPNGPEQISMV
jgi:hypothetical protein